MRKETFFLSFVFLSLLSVSGAAQTSTVVSPDPASQAEAGNPKKVQQKAQPPHKEETRKEFETVSNVGTQSVRPATRELSPFLVSPNGKQRKLLLPSATDTARYAAFLEQPKTGLIKLFPDIGCEENARVLRVDNGCLEWIPTSAFYSFREREHSREFLSDLILKNNSFVSNGFLSQGILVALGDVPLEQMSLSADGMKFLTDYKPSVQGEEAVKQFNMMSRGVRIGKYLYRNSLPALENMTYALRVVAYRAAVYRAFQGRLYNILEGDNRQDIIVAFRLVRREGNGNLTLLWKELDRKSAPRVVIPKRGRNRESAGAPRFQG
jgi:hypothetical protein